MNFLPSVKPKTIELKKLRALTIFKFHRSRNFSPRLNVKNEELKSCIYDLHENLEWNQQIQKICVKTKEKFHIIQKLMKNGFDFTFILEVFCKEI